MIQIPKEYTAQDHLRMAKPFLYSKSVNPEVIAVRKQRRGTRANIINDQSAGLEIGTGVLESLDDQQLQATWAQIYGGAMLNSALYMLQAVPDSTMSRRFTLAPVLAKDGTLRDDDERTTMTYTTLGATLRNSNEYEATAADYEPKTEQTFQLGRKLGNTSMLLAVFGTELYEKDDAKTNMMIVKKQTVQMHHHVQQLATRITYNPTLAQLRSESSPLGSYIMQSNDIPVQVKAAFRASLAEHNDESGY